MLAHSYVSSVKSPPKEKPKTSRYCILLPCTALDSLKLFGCHTVARREVT